MILAPKRTLIGRGRLRADKVISWHERSFDALSVRQLYAIMALRAQVFVVEQRCAYQDADGYVYMFDRFKDMIISGGFNIFPFEVESALMKHPAVQDCAVIGVPDDKWGEAVKAFVVLKPGQMLTRDEITARFKGQIAGYKRPRSVLFTHALPKLPSGKVSKLQLRQTDGASALDQDRP